MLVEELTSLGTIGTIIRNEIHREQFPINGPGIIQVGTKPLDTDGDGISDAFEDKWGVDKKFPVRCNENSIQRLYEY